MAYFNPKELAELIRHEFIVHDDTGRCMKILQPPSRKAKPGGLPLNFRSTADSESSSEEHSPCYLATADCESTYELIQERLRSRFLEIDLSGADDEEKPVESDAADTRPSTPDSEFFQYKDVPVVSSSPIPAAKSITAELLEKTDFIIRPDLAAYARFAAPDNRSGRKLLVFYPSIEPEPELDSDKRTGFSLTLYARPQTRILDLVGLCCYEYARSRRNNDIGDISQYHLLMAEENGEIDEDLPPVDGHRLLSELGSCWSTVALVKRHAFTNSSLGTTNIVVYTVSGGRYEFLVESLDVSLRWLRDQAVQKRIEDEGQDFISDCPALQEYVLETVDQRDVVLDLDMSVSSTACTEFLLLRINSSRGDFTPTSYRASSVEQRSLGLKIHTDSISSSPLERPQRFDLNRRIHSTTGSVSSMPSFDSTDLLSSAIAVYPVERIHRYKPKWSASLSIRADGLEISPTQTDRSKKRSPLFLQSPQKTLRLSWDRIGGAEIVDRSSAKRVIRIVWLAESKSKEVLKAGEFSAPRRDSTLSTESDRSAGSDETSRQTQLHSDGYWKMLQLEADVNEAWDIAEKLCTIIDERNSKVRQIYKHSHGGTKKPKDAAAEAFGSAATLSLKGRSSPASPMARGVSRLTSTVTSAVPALHRLLSKHD